MKITPHQETVLNDLLHKIVEKRDGKKCLRCGKTEQLALSHIYPKGKYKRMKFDERNLKFLCYYCHIHFWHKNPIEAHEWLKTVIDKKRLDKLKAISLSRDMWSFDYKAIKLVLEQLVKKL